MQSQRKKRTRRGIDGETTNGGTKGKKKGGTQPPFVLEVEVLPDAEAVVLVGELVNGECVNDLKHLCAIYVALKGGGGIRHNHIHSDP
jgi:hypothetical protein